MNYKWVFEAIERLDGGKKEEEGNEEQKTCSEEKLCGSS